MRPTSPLLIAVLIGCVVLALASSAPLAVLLSGLSIWLAVALLWRPGTLPLLLMPIGFQWTQATLLPLYASATGRNLNDLSLYNAELGAGALMAAAGIMALAIGMRLGAGQPSSLIADRAREEARILAPRQVYMIVALALGAGHLAEALAGYTGGAVQLVRSLGAFKLSGLFILTYWSSATGKGKPVLLLVALFEILIGLLGFFSDYRDTLFVVGIGLLAGQRRFKPQSILTLTLAGALSIALLVFWTVVKPDYRQFVNYGTGEHAALRPIEERIAFLLEKATSLDVDQAAKGFDDMIARVSYIDYLSLAMQYVPASRAHELGAQTWDAVSHVLMPRILFPDKPPLPNDTYVTVQYTGLSFSAAELTSISIGWLGEFYIDFGVVGALIVTIMLGALIGRLYSMLLTQLRQPALLSSGLAIMPLASVMLFETALPKLVGAVVMAAIAGTLIRTYGVAYLVSMVGAERVASEATANIMSRRNTGGFGHPGGLPARVFDHQPRPPGHYN